MSTTSQTPHNCSFLLLPLELRDRIYAQLVSIKHTQTPKDVEACLRCTTFYNWNLNPTILRVNRQINKETQAVMARDNNFVVIERAKDLEQRPGDAKKEDPTIMVYSVALWPGKPTKKPVVPGERVRIKLERAGASEEDMDAHVILADELRDVCVGLSTFQRPEGKYLTSGLSASINVHKPTYTETAAARDVRERALLEPLQKLRHLAHVSIRGTLPAIEYQISRQLTHPTLDRGLVLTTIDELISTGDQASSNGDHGIATAHYQRASEYFHHSATHERQVFTPSPVDVSAFEFKIMQHRSRNWIEAGNFSDALESAQIALYVANQLFRINSSITTGPPTDANGRTSAAAFRKWTCECIKEGAARNGQRLKCEDIGRCYYYKSISEQVVLGDEATAQADDDKFTAIGCCLVSDTMKDSVPAELLQLDKRTIEKVSGQNGEEGEDEEDEDEREEWADEEWSTEEEE